MSDTVEVVEEETEPTLQAMIRQNAKVLELEALVKKMKEHTTFVAYRELKAYAAVLGQAGADFKGIGKAKLTQPTEVLEINDHHQMLAWLDETGRDGWVENERIACQRLQRDFDTDTLPVELRNLLCEHEYVESWAVLSPELEAEILAFPRHLGLPTDRETGTQLEATARAKSEERPQLTPDRNLRARERTFLTALVTQHVGELESGT